MTGRIEAARAALLVMDYQRGIVQRIADDALVERTGATVAAARAADGHVGWVRVAFTDSDVEAIPSTSVFAQMTTPERRAEMHAEAAATQIDERLSPQPHDASVRKLRVGAFTTTDLAEQLAARGVDTLVLAGISTSGVVLSTVREAMDRDYRIVVLRDGCADPDPEVHDFLMDRIYPRYASVITTEELGELWA